MAAVRPAPIGRITDVTKQLENDAYRWWGMFATLMVFAFAAGGIAYITTPRPFSVAFVVLVLAVLACSLRPRVGVYVIVSLTLIGDIVTTSWWPFTKNLSSKESILYLTDSVSVNPLEIMLVATTVSWLLQRLVDPTWRFNRGALFTPVMLFSAFVIFGFVRGKFLGGGDTRVALFEGRPLLYLPIVYILVTNLLTTRRHYRFLLLLAFAAVAIQSIFALSFYRGLADEQREVLESLSEHSATVHMNALFVFLLALLLFKCRKELRWFVACLVPPVLYAYFLSQRRAAMIALFVGVAVLAIVLFHRRRRMFWFFTPTAVVLALGYLAATWNAVGALGLPAQAVKTVLFPEQLSAADRSSDLYREIESYDLWFTIQQNKVLGVGFGKEFLRPVSLPDISFFEFWEYIPHNSVLWIWLKTGFLGFVAMFFLFGRAAQLGARSVLAVRTPEHAAIVVAGLAYVLMFLVFAYVDIVWDVRSTVFLALALALCADFALAQDTARHPADRHLHTRQLETVRL
jgi:O-antigen ligase